MTDKIVVLSTCASEEEAHRIAGELIERRLAACVNVLPPVRSIYHWKGAVEQSEEILMMIKTARSKFDKLRAELARMHTYEVPEIIAVPILDGNASYLEWMDRELGEKES